MANKFHAAKVTYFGETFDSKAEGERWLILRQLEKQGVGDSWPSEQKGRGRERGRRGEGGGLHLHLLCSFCTRAVGDLEETPRATS